MEFNDEDLRDFMQSLQMEEFGRKLQKAWDESGRSIKAAIQFAAMGTETHPMIRAALQVTNNDFDINKTRQEWDEVKKLVDVYFGLIQAALEAFGKMKGGNHGK